MITRTDPADFLMLSETLQSLMPCLKESSIRHTGSNSLVKASAR